MFERRGLRVFAPPVCFGICTNPGFNFIGLGQVRFDTSVLFSSPIQGGTGVMRGFLDATRRFACDILDVGRYQSSSIHFSVAYAVH